MYEFCIYYPHQKDTYLSHSQAANMADLSCIFVSYHLGIASDATKTQVYVHLFIYSYIDNPYTLTILVSSVAHRRIQLLQQVTTQLLWTLKKIKASDMPSSSIGANYFMLLSILCTLIENVTTVLIVSIYNPTPVIYMNIFGQSKIEGCSDNRFCSDNPNAYSMHACNMCPIIQNSHVAVFIRSDRISL